MRVVLLGPPGAGKGTQAVRIAQEADIPHIATGDMFRQAVREETSLGLEVKRYLDAGRLVPDEVTVGIVRERLARPDCREGFILDGFPRTVPQAEALDGVLAGLGMKLDRVVSLVVGTEALVRRLAGRRVCGGCGTSFHVELNPPQEEGRCDRCGGVLVQRDDDREETVRERLAVYERQTAPLVDYYRRHGLLVEVDGEQPPDAVTRAIRQAVGNGFPAGSGSGGIESRQ